MSDPRFETGLVRFDHEDELFAIVEEWTRERTKHEAMRELASAGVPCSAVMDTHELFTDPHLTERGLVHELDHPEVGPVKVMGMPARLSGSKVPLVPAPLLGQHTREVLSDLGFDEAEVDALHEQGVIG